LVWCGFLNDCIILFLQVADCSEYSQSQAAFFQFAQRNPIFGPEIAPTRAIVGFLEIRGRVHGRVDQLY
jgi:hypothetical protein